MNNSETMNAIRKMRDVLEKRAKLVEYENKDAGHDVARAIDDATSLIVEGFGPVLDAFEATEEDRVEAWSCAAGLALCLRDARGGRITFFSPDDIGKVGAALARYDRGVKP